MIQGEFLTIRNVQPSTIRVPLDSSLVSDLEDNRNRIVSEYNDHDHRVVNLP
jgi:hypothetical protein